MAFLKYFGNVSFIAVKKVVLAGDGGEHCVTTELSLLDGVLLCQGVNVNHN